MPASTHSDRPKETAAAKIRIRTSGLSTCLPRRRNGPRRCASSTLFGPTTASRSAACAAVSPPGLEPSDAVTSPASRLQYGAVGSETLTRGQCVATSRIPHWRGGRTNSRDVRRISQSVPSFGSSAPSICHSCLHVWHAWTSGARISCWSNAPSAFQTGAFDRAHIVRDGRRHSKNLFLLRQTSISRQGVPGHG